GAVLWIRHIEPVAGDVIATDDRDLQVLADTERCWMHRAHGEAVALPGEDVLVLTWADHLGEDVIARHEATEEDRALHAVTRIGEEIDLRIWLVKPEGDAIHHLGAVHHRVGIPGMAVVAFRADALVDRDVT